MADLPFFSGGGGSSGGGGGTSNYADNIKFNKEDNSIQLTSNGKPIGDKIFLSAITGKSIDSVSITENGELVIFYNDSSSTNVGRVVGKDGKVYVPHIDEHKILTFTLEDMAGEIPDPVDLNPYDEWQDMDDKGTVTDYVWEPM